MSKKDVGLKKANYRKKGDFFFSSRFEVSHSSEIRGLCLMKLPSEVL